MRNVRIRYRIKFNKTLITKETIITYYFDLDEIETGLIQHRKFLDSKSEILSRDFSSGFCDKKGLDIYEGDIVKIGDDIDCVKLADGCFLLKYETGYEKLLYVWKGEIEVIGNKYDNPELLKEQP